ncbi:hypothetical protein CDAR_87541 [Caerostris darwini]|uniref:Uncharacterized protein n=1 Tax=Caerostris darwini TaxID=1538125 RepID=A0AAV4X008_9ARAC|nr:hypothetical protein CDAR_87541 [Caerostris darwini]
MRAELVSAKGHANLEVALLVYELSTGNGRVMVPIPPSKEIIPNISFSEYLIVRTKMELDFILIFLSREQAWQIAISCPRLPDFLCHP